MCCRVGFLRQEKPKHVSGHLRSSQRTCAHLRLGVERREQDFQDVLRHVKTFVNELYKNVRHADFNVLSGLGPFIQDADERQVSLRRSQRDQKLV